MNTPLVIGAMQFAREMHRGQTDKAGMPYIDHCRRVAENVSRTEWWAAPDYVIAAAWLHDVVEDCGVSVSEINKRFGPGVADIVELLSSKKGTYRERVMRIAQSENVGAIRVKMADIEDNLDPGRLALLEPEEADRLRRKYEDARHVLKFGMTIHLALHGS